MTPPASEPDSTVDIEGLHNLRDVSASVDTYAKLRPRRLFRSDVPSATSVEALGRDLGIECFLDLRSATDARAMPCTEGSVYINVPLADVGAADNGRRRPESLATDYVRRLNQDHNLPAAITALARLLPRPTVVYCTAGKDRTGLLIATTLAIVGVEHEAIIEDYLRTAENLDDLLARRRAHAALTLPSHFYECSEPAMREFLHSMDNVHGGAEQWALNSGISRRVLQHLRDSLCDLSAA